MKERITAASIGRKKVSWTAVLVLVLVLVVVLVLAAVSRSLLQLSQAQRQNVMMLESSGSVIVPQVLPFSSGTTISSVVSSPSTSAESIQFLAINSPSCTILQMTVPCPC